MDSIKEYKEKIKLGAKIAATIHYRKVDRMTTFVGHVVKVQTKQFVIEGVGGLRFWLTFPLVRNVTAIKGDAIRYENNGNDCRVEILEAAR